MYTGLLLKESLLDESVLEGLRITRTETWHVENAADFQPKIWTAISIEGPDDEADDAAARLSRAIRPDWYANLSTDAYNLVVFQDRVFKYRCGDPAGRAEAQAYARSVGIPEHQLDWGE